VHILPDCHYIGAANARVVRGRILHMLFWLLALAVTAIACAALYYAGTGRRVNAVAPAEEPAEVAHLKLQLKEIESDAALGRLQPAEAVAAKAELAREVLRVKREAGVAAKGEVPRRLLAGIAVAATAALSFGVYAALGRPDVPAAPLEARADIPPKDLTLKKAVARIEAQLQKAPGDVRGWTVIAPAYMQMGRFADAANALRKLIALDGPTADRETDLGEALMLAAGGSAEGEPLKLFESAAARDPAHVRSRYYIAGEAMQRGDFEAAKADWQALIALGKGDESWLPNAQAGLEAAEAALRGEVALPDSTAVAAMVEGLAARLNEQGGSIEEWTRLVRSRLVQGQREQAQQAYDAARKAYPDAAARTELDVLAADNGLVASN
jgi:cytochrome c-type biogenesis protein CcmH